MKFPLPRSNYEVVFTAVTYIDIISLHLRAPNDFSAGNPKNNKSKITNVCSMRHKNEW